MLPYTRLSLGAVLAGVIAAAGCANLSVKKVPAEDRASGKDLKVRGFRYYLTRPYIAVEDKIPLCERKTYVAVKRETPAKKVTVTFLEGPRKGQSCPLEDLTVGEPSAGALRPVTEAELASIRQVLKDRAGAAATDPAPSPKAGDRPAPDPAVRPVAMQAGAADAVPPDVSQLQFPTAYTSAPPGQAVIANSNIQILFLPDLDEQYAVKSCNWLAKSAFRLDFDRGAVLSDVQGDHDSTAVVLALIQAVDKAITAGQQIADATINRQQALQKPGAPAMLPLDDGTEFYTLVESSYIKPGIYRLNKPWENDHDCPPVAGCGLLSKLGLPVAVDVAFRKDQ